MEDNQQPKEEQVSPPVEKGKKKGSPVVGFISTVIVIAIAGAAGFFLLGGRDDNNKVVSTNTDSAQTSTVDANKTYTKENVAEHSTKADCWTIVEGKVYDITKYVPRHPGGDDILEACGTDGTSLFTERKTASGEKVGSGTPHSSMAEDQLKQLQVGTLAN